MERLDAVVTLLRSSPKWSVFTNAAALSLGFLIGFFPLLTDELGEQEQVNVQGEQAVRESVALGAVYDLTHAALKAHQAAVSRYQEGLAGRRDITLSDEQIRQGIAETSAARNSIAIAVGAMQGITVSDSLVGRTLEKLSVATGKLDRNMQALQNTYVALLSTDPATMTTRRGELQNALSYSDATAAELLTAFASYHSAAKAWMKSRSVTIGNATSRAKLFIGRILVAVLAFVVLVGYGVALLITVFQPRKETSRIIIAR